VLERDRVNLRLAPSDASHDFVSPLLTGVRMRRARLVLLCYVAACSTAPRSDVDPSVTLAPPGGKTRVVDFTTDEGTGMSVSVSPDGSWLAFDLLGHVYRMPASGGQAVALTQNSGPALNFHPAISPDGTQIAFTSDRNGQLNIWVMDADGTNPRLVHGDSDTRYLQPAWDPDGKSVVAVRLFRSPGRSWHRQNRTLYRLPIGGGDPVALIDERLTQPDAPAFSPDGKQLYFQVSYSIGEGLGMLTAGHRILRRDNTTGTLENVRLDSPAEPTPEFRAALNSGGYAQGVGDEPAVTTPKVSPDGKWLAFSKELLNETFEWRGHQVRPATALWLRNLETGDERQLLARATKDLTRSNTQYAYRAFPGYDWTPDSRSIILTVGGKIQRLDVASGALAPIPFTARVLRTLAEPVRGQVTIDDDSLRVKFIQWPAGSPDGKRLLFTAVGRLWVMELPNGTPRALTTDMLPAFQLAGAWSPDGASIAFTTWDDSARGQLWIVAAAGGAPRRVSTVPGEYLGPVWSPDGAAIAVSRGPGPGKSSWNPWNEVAGWEVARFPAAGGAPVTVARDLVPWTLAGIGVNGGLTFATQPTALAGSPLATKPFPDASFLANRVRVRRASWDGTLDSASLDFPVRRGRGNTPSWSPDGTWVAFDAAHVIYASSTSSATAAQAIEPDPNVEATTRTIVGEWGGLYPRWRDAGTLEFSSGNRYITWSPATRKATAIDVRLTIPKPRPDGVVALVGAKIVSLDSAGVIERGTILVKGARIACIGTCDTTGVSRVIHLEGKTIIPGLVDLHAHHTDEESGIVPQHRPASSLDMAYGVTTVVDPATTSESAFPLAELTEAGLVMGPNTFSSGEFVISHGIAWGDYEEIRTLDDAREHVNKRAQWGAVTIKNYRQPGRRQHQWLAMAARERGISLTSEGGPLALDVGYAIDGQTGWEHMIADVPLYKDATTFFGKAGLVYSPTLMVAGLPNGSMQYFRPRADLMNEPRTRRFMPYDELAARVASSKPTPIEDVVFPIMAEGVADIVRAGGYAAIGEHGEQTGIGSHWELWAYATGLTPLEALKIATWDGAYFIGAHEEIGSIRVGKRADLAILDADPLVDIHNSSKVSLVMRGGRLFETATLDEVWPGKARYGRLPWPTAPSPGR